MPPSSFISNSATFDVVFFLENFYFMPCIDNINLQTMVDNSKTIRIKQKSQKPYKIHLGLFRYNQ